MAEINTGKKGAPRVDMTPMVDLGFLLITFFILATTLSKPKAMQIIKPAKAENEKDQPPLKKSKSLSVLLGENHKVYWYVGSDEAGAGLSVDSTDFSRTGIRKIVLQRQSEVAQQWGDKDQLVVLIKSMPTAKYKDMVDILDEMKITNTKQYALVDLDKNDTTIMESLHTLGK